MTCGSQQFFLSNNYLLRKLSSLIQFDEEFKFIFREIVLGPYIIFHASIYPDIIFIET